MAHFSNDFPDFDMKQAQKMAQSDAAKQLFALLQSSGSDQLQSAMAQAAAGDMTEARALLRQLMENEQARGLLRQIQEDANG